MSRGPFLATRFIPFPCPLTTRLSAPTASRGAHQDMTARRTTSRRINEAKTKRVKFWPKQMEAVPAWGRHGAGLAPAAEVLFLFALAFPVMASTLNPAHGMRTPGG